MSIARPDGADDLIRYINSLKEKRVMIWKYGPDKLCDKEGYILSKTTAAFAGGYTNTFLLAPNLEFEISKDREWNFTNIKILQEKFSSFDNIILVENVDVNNFLRHSKFFKINYYSVIKFTNYQVFRISSP